MSSESPPDAPPITVPGFPWMEPEEIGAITDILKKRFRSKAKVLEFGAGGSTLAFSRHASSWTAIEHDAGWASRTIEALERDGIRNVSVDLVPPEFPHRGFDAAEPGQFTTYVSAATRHRPQGGFDFVLVDGRARIDCLVHLAAGGLLAEGSIVVLHDFSRRRYLRRSGEVLKHYVLNAVVVGDSGAGLGVFEYRVAGGG